MFSADALSPGRGDEIVTTFQRAREADYRDLKREADKLLKSVRARRAAPRSAGAAWNWVRPASSASTIFLFCDLSRELQAISSDLR